MTEEDKIQANIVRTVRLYYKRTLIFSVPNGGWRAKKTAGILKLTGALPGVSDLICLHKGKVYFIEVKTETGRQSESQKEFEKFVTQMGFPYYIVRSAEQILKILDAAC